MNTIHEQWRETLTNYLSVVYCKKINYTYQNALHYYMMDFVDLFRHFDFQPWMQDLDQVPEDMGPFHKYDENILIFFSHMSLLMPIYNGLKDSYNEFQNNFLQTYITLLNKSKLYKPPGFEKVSYCRTSFYSSFIKYGDQIEGNSMQNELDSFFLELYMKENNIDESTTDIEKSKKFHAWIVHNQGEDDILAYGDKLRKAFFDHFENKSDLSHNQGGEL